MKPLECRCPRAEVGASEGSHRTGDCVQVNLRYRPATTGRRNPIDPALLGITHAVAADAGVIPVGHQQRTVGGDADVTRPEPLISRTVNQRLSDSRIAGTGWLGQVGPNNIGTGIAVNQLAPVFRRQQAALVDADAGRRTGARQQQVWHHAWVVLVPVLQRHLRLEVGAGNPPAGPRQFVDVAVVAVFHHPVDADAAVAVVVVVALPEAAKGIDCNLIVIPEVVAENLKVAAIWLAAKDHALSEGVARVVDRLAEAVVQQVAVTVMDRPAGVAEVEIEPAVRADRKGVNRMVMLRPSGFGEEHLFAVGN